MPDQKLSVWKQACMCHPLPLSYREPLVIPASLISQKGPQEYLKVWGPAKEASQSPPESATRGVPDKGLEIIGPQHREIWSRISHSHWPQFGSCPWWECTSYQSLAPASMATLTSRSVMALQMQIYIWPKLFPRPIENDYQYLNCLSSRLAHFSSTRKRSACGQSNIILGPTCL